VALVATHAAACTPRIGEGGDPVGGDDGADAAPEPVDDLPPADGGSGDDEADDGCYSNAISELVLIDSTAIVDGSGVEAFYGLTGAIDDVPAGLFYLDLYGGLGTLEAGVAPGSYLIAGDDTDWSLCAVCAWASFGVSEEIWLMAQSGTVRIDQVGDHLAGALEQIELVEIDEQDLPVAGGCSALVEEVSFEVAVQ
jgi:hypothetical protein